VVEVGRFLLYAVPTVVVLYSLIDALQTRRDDVRSLPKWLWLIVILLVPLLGALAWLYAGRPPRRRGRRRRRPSRAAGSRRRPGLPAHHRRRHVVAAHAPAP